MRISPVTGDLPVVVTPAAPVPAVLPDTTTPRPAVAQASAAESGSDARSSDQRRAPAHLPVFDPPLIAQRAVLGLPIGGLLADLARDEGITYDAALAAVSQHLPPRVLVAAESEGGHGSGPAGQDAPAA